MFVIDDVDWNIVMNFIMRIGIFVGNNLNDKIGYENL